MPFECRASCLLNGASSLLNGACCLLNGASCLNAGLTCLRTSFFLGGELICGDLSVGRIVRYP